MQEKLGPRATDRATHGRRKSRVEENEWDAMWRATTRRRPVGSGGVTPDVAGVTEGLIADVEGLDGWRAGGLAGNWGWCYQRVSLGSGRCSCTCTVSCQKALDCRRRIVCAYSPEGRSINGGCCTACVRQEATAVESLQRVLERLGLVWRKRCRCLAFAGGD